MATLRTNYKDDILAAAMDGKRQYQMINNPNGTVSFVDVTEYTQNGDTLTSGDINGIDTQVNTNTGNITTNTNHINANSLHAPRNITSDLASLTTAISEQNLEKYGYKVGDYFTGASGYTYWIADFDPYYTGIQDDVSSHAEHHIGVLVDTKTNSKWHTANDDTFYQSSTLNSFITGTVLNNVENDITQLIGTWSSHLSKMRVSDSYTKLIIAPSDIHIMGAWRTNYTPAAHYVLRDYERYYSIPEYAYSVRQLEIFRKYHYSLIFGINKVWTCSKTTSGALLGDQTNREYGAVSVRNTTPSSSSLASYSPPGLNIMEDKTTENRVFGLILLK